MQKHLQDRRAPVREGVIEYLLPRMERSVSAARVSVLLGPSSAGSLTIESSSSPTAASASSPAAARPNTSG